ncbi:hypothetical protein ACQJBY_043649 [Aegilops geniculata]
MGGAAAKHGAMMTAVYYHDVSLSTYLSRNAKLCSIINTMANSHQFRLSLDWELVRRKASLIVYELLLQSPELRRLLILPRETLNPQQLFPIGPRRPRRPLRKQARRPTSTAMARLYLNTKRRYLQVQHDNYHEIEYLRYCDLSSLNLYVIFTNSHFPPFLQPVQFKKPTSCTVSRVFEEGGRSYRSMFKRW